MINGKKDTSETLRIFKDGKVVTDYDKDEKALMSKVDSYIDQCKFNVNDPKMPKDLTQPPMCCASYTNNNKQKEAICSISEN